MIGGCVIMKKRSLQAIISIVIVLSMCLQMSVFALGTPFSDYVDIPNNHWAYASIKYVIDHNIMGETDDYHFDPDETASRAMIITTIHRIAGSPTPSNTSTAPFPDVPVGSWYCQPIQWAKQIGIIEGYDDGDFRPMMDMPREQIALIMYRYAQYLNYITDGTGANTDQFPDYNETPVGCKPAMKWAIKKYMLVGRDNGKLMPNAAATRAELATCLHRFIVNNIDPTGILVTPATKTVSKGWTGMLYVSLLPATYRINNPVVYWSSSDSLVATVNSSGQISAIRSGTTTITASTANGVYSASCVLTVTPALTYPDTLITDDNIKEKILACNWLWDENQKAYQNGTITYSEMVKARSSIERQSNMLRADYIVVGNNPFSEYAYAVLGGDSSATIPYAFSRNLERNATGLDVMVVQRALEVMGYYQPESEDEYGTFGENSYDAACSYPLLMSQEENNLIFNDVSFNVLFQASTISKRTFEAYSALNQARVIHNFVAMHSAGKVANGTYKMSDNKINKGNATGTYYGYADVLSKLSNQTYLWEVKPNRIDYYNPNGIGQRQIDRYLLAGNDVNTPQNFAKPLLPGYSLGSYSLPFFDKYINVQSYSSTDSRSALILYQSELATQPSYVVEYEPVSVEQPEPRHTFATDMQVVLESLGNTVITAISYCGDELMLVLLQEEGYIYVSLAAIACIVAA